MPEIVQYEAPDAKSTINPSNLNRGEESLAQAGRIVTSYGEQEKQSFHQLGETVKDVAEVYDKHQTMQEVSNGSTSAMKMDMDMTNEWEAMKKSGAAEDPNQVTAFQEKWTKQRNDWTNSFSTDRGKEWATEHTAHWAEEWQHKMAADVSTLAGDRVVANDVTRAALASGNSSRDPSSTGYNINQYIDSAHEEMKLSSMSGTAAAKWEEHIQTHANQMAFDGAMGAARMGADYTKILDSDTQARLNGAQINELSRARLSAQEQQKVQARGDLNDQKIKLQAKVDHATAAILDPSNGDVTYSDSGVPAFGKDFTKHFQQVVHLANSASDGVEIDTAKLRALNDWHQKEVADAAKGVEPITDKPTLAGLVGGITDPNAEVNIYRARIDGKISSKDTELAVHLAKAYQERFKQNPLEKKTIDSALLGVKEQLLGKFQPGQEGYAAGITAAGRYNAWFYEHYMQGLAAGDKPTAMVSGAPGSLNEPSFVAKNFKINGDDLHTTKGGTELQTLPALPGNPPKAGEVPKPGEKPPLGSFFGGGGKLAPGKVPPPAATPAPKEGPPGA